MGSAGSTRLPNGVRCKLRQGLASPMVSADQGTVDTYAVGRHVRADRTAAQLAAESFPGTAADAVAVAANPGMQAGGPDP